MDLIGRRVRLSRIKEHLLPLRVGDFTPTQYFIRCIFDNADILMPIEVRNGSTLNIRKSGKEAFQLREE